MIDFLRNTLVSKNQMHILICKYSKQIFVKTCIDGKLYKQI